MSIVTMSKSRKAEQVEKPNEAIRIQIITPAIGLVYEDDKVAAAVIDVVSKFTDGMSIFEVSKFGLKVAEDYHLDAEELKLDYLPVGNEPSN